MPANTTVFFMGLGIGIGLLAIGVLLGYLLAKRIAPAEKVDKELFLGFLRNLSNWTTEFSGDVSKYQSQLSDLSAKAQGGGAIRGEQMQRLLSQIMNVNEQLKDRLDSAEERLEEQTDQISSYLTEARTDGLTGLFNRRAFDRATDELFSDWHKKSESFSLCLIDIDHFKSINDTHGHQAGDEVLVRLAALLRQETSDAFCVARYGGEEFAILSKEPLADASAELERLRQVIEEERIVFEDVHIPITISGGSAEIQSDDKIGNVVRRADEALYASKLGGRNRIHLHDATLCRLVTAIEQPSPVTEAAPEQSAAEQREEGRNQSRVSARLERIVAEESRRVLDS